MQGLAGIRAISRGQKADFVIDFWIFGLILLYSGLFCVSLFLEIRLDLCDNCGLFKLLLNNYPVNCVDGKIIIKSIVSPVRDYRLSVSVNISGPDLLFGVFVNYVRRL